MVLLSSGTGTPAGKHPNTKTPPDPEKWFNEGTPGNVGRSSGSRGGGPRRVGPLLGRFGLGRRLAGVQRLQQAEESGGLADAAELDAEGLDLDEQVLYVDDLVPDQGLQEDADQPDQAVLEGGADVRTTAVPGGADPRCRTCMYLSLICSQVEMQLEM